VCLDGLAGVVSQSRSVATRLAEFAGDLTTTRVPDHVLDHARWHVLDGVGVALGASTFDFASGLVGAVRSLELSGPPGGINSVIGRPERFGLRDAAMLNGALIHGLDFDDTYMPGTIHPTAAVLPACLAVGEQIGATGADVFAAYVAGVEVACALAGAVPPGGLVHRGFHPTGVIGAFAATVAVARLRGLTTVVSAQAQGIVGSMSSSLMEFIETGASVKRVHPGWAAAAAITAVALAANGMTGPERVYEGRYGFFATHLDSTARDLDLRPALDRLGRDWALPRVAIKPFPVCHYIHALADAAIELATEHRFSARDVSSVSCWLHPGQFSLVVDPIDVKRVPDSPYAAQFSAPYVVAVALARRQFALGDLAADRLSDPDVLDLATRINFVADPHSRFPDYFSGAIRVELADRRVLDFRVETNRGSDADPMTPAQIEAKFHATAELAVSGSTAARIRESVYGLSKHDDLGQLLSAVREVADPLRVAEARANRGSAQPSRSSGDRTKDTKP
jgi:2-methylcitrate dehydratase PrpD